MGFRIRVPDSYSLPDRLVFVELGVAAGFLQGIGDLPRPIDAWTYWTANLSHLYPATWGPDGLYVYPPILAQLLAPLHALGWPLFITIWTTALFAALGYMLGRWAWLFFIAGAVQVMLHGALPAEVGDVLGHALNGNVQLFIAAGIVFAFRGRPLAWVPGLLTKVPAALGLGWYVARFEWRPLAKILAAATVVCAISFALAPDPWFQWFDFVRRNTDVPAPVLMEPVPFLARLPMSLAILVWGARTGRAWTVPIAVGWGTPALYLGTYPSMWIAAVPLWFDRRRALAAAKEDDVIGVAPEPLTVAP